MSTEKEIIVNTSYNLETNHIRCCYQIQIENATENETKIVPETIHELIMKEENTKQNEEDEFKIEKQKEYYTDVSFAEYDENVILTGNTAHNDVRHEYKVTKPLQFIGRRLFRKLDEKNHRILFLTESEKQFQQKVKKIKDEEQIPFHLKELPSTSLWKVDLKNILDYKFETDVINKFDQLKEDMKNSSEEKEICEELKIFQKHLIFASNCKISDNELKPFSEKNDTEDKEIKLNIYLIICFNIMKRELIKKYPNREFEFRSTLLNPIMKSRINQILYICSNFNDIINRITTDEDNQEVYRSVHNFVEKYCKLEKFDENDFFLKEGSMKMFYPQNNEEHFFIDMYPEEIVSLSILTQIYTIKYKLTIQNKNEKVIKKEIVEKGGLKLILTKNSNIQNQLKTMSETIFTKKLSTKKFMKRIPIEDVYGKTFVELLESLHKYHDSNELSIIPNTELNRQVKEMIKDPMGWQMEAVYENYPYDLVAQTFLGESGKDENFSFEEIMAMIISPLNRELQKNVNNYVNKLKEENETTNYIINYNTAFTVPSNFDDKQKDTIENAFKILGIDVECFSETEAIMKQLLTNVNNNNTEKSNKYIIIKCGDCDMNVTYVFVDEENENNIIERKNLFTNRVGSEEFTTLMIKYIKYVIEKQIKDSVQNNLYDYQKRLKKTNAIYFMNDKDIEMTELLHIKRRTIHYLEEVAEEIKYELIENEEYKLKDDQLNRLFGIEKTRPNWVSKIEFKFKREEFENLCKNPNYLEQLKTQNETNDISNVIDKNSLYAQIQKIINEIKRETNLDWNSISKVLLVGKETQMQLFEKILIGCHIEKNKLSTKDNLNPLNCIGFGAIKLLQKECCEVVMDVKHHTCLKSIYLDIFNEKNQQVGKLLYKEGDKLLNQTADTLTNFLKQEDLSKEVKDCCKELNLQIPRDFGSFTLSIHVEEIDGSKYSWSGDITDIPKLEEIAPYRPMKLRIGITSNYQIVVIYKFENINDDDNIDQTLFTEWKEMSGALKNENVDFIFEMKKKHYNKLIRFESNF